MRTYTSDMQLIHGIIHHTDNSLQKFRQSLNILFIYQEHKYSYWYKVNIM